ncbi:MAG: hypothetical protein PHN51_00935 [Candidatus Nanopelagicales bacterium]|nr:hypothetical protein [Candidatus Nanopelagicales bacterium]
MTTHQHSARPSEVLRATLSERPGDSADQADRLAMIMEAEAIESALHGSSGEGELDGFLYPLENAEEVLSMEDADDGSDDPRHAGEPGVWKTAEELAMHVIGDNEVDEILTPEDETLLGIDPYED